MTRLFDHLGAFLAQLQLVWQACACVITRVMMIGKMTTEAVCWQSEGYGLFAACQNQ
jgi:hypothetical protein